MKNAAVNSNDLKKIEEFFKYGKTLHNYKKFDFSDCPLGNYLTEIEEKILKKGFLLKTKVSIFYAYQPSTLKSVEKNLWWVFN